uniref:Uncharacterized protein n=1 Tax=Romanomermis culicivorax TaxID=13658 RepID=A0A915KRX9_ROMCU
MGVAHKSLTIIDIVTPSRFANHMACRTLPGETNPQNFASGMRPGRVQCAFANLENKTGLQYSLVCAIRAIWYYLAHNRNQNANEKRRVVIFSQSKV